MHLQSQFYDALLNPELKHPDTLVSWNGSDVQSRFDVYRNNVISSLIDALADTFPVTQDLVGVEFFRAMTLLYVKSNLPQSCVLSTYGASFPDFVTHFPPVTSLPYLADVARLEYAYVQTYHCRDTKPIDHNQISHLLTNVDQLTELSVCLRPAVYLLKSSFAVGSLWLAHQGNLDITQISPLSPENILLIRPSLDVGMLRLTNADAFFIEALKDGVNLAGATAIAISIDVNFNLSEILLLLLQHQLILSISFKEHSS